jgi:threonine/homoserine/homoserine lactone efflux protein
MPADTLFAFAIFALVTSITPGPNNLMLLASGVNFGFRSSVPHMLGISLGFLVMVMAVGLGLAEVFNRFPWIHGVLKWVGAIYMLYLAWCIAHSGPPDDPGSRGRSSRPLGFLGAAAFQWVNPKAWVMALSAFSTYVPASGGIKAIVLAALLFAAVNLPSVGLWALSGARLRHFLQGPRNLRLFNHGMAGLLVVSLYPLLRL